jgi:general secretion pathway protein K
MRHIKQNKSGFVIVVVLCIVTMLAVTLLFFNRQTKNDLYAAETLQKNYQSFNCANSALNIAIAAIRSTSAGNEKSSTDLPPADKTFDIDSCRCSVTITDENGKINLNSLIDQQGKPDKNVIEQFLRLVDLLNRRPGPRIDYSIAPALVDWLDTDDNVVSLPFLQNDNLGAESAYYQKLNPAYKCSNAPLNSVDELLLVKGVTAETLERLQNYITVYGNGKININSAPGEVIESLSEKMDPGLAQAVIDKRKLQPFKTVAQLRQFPWMTDAIYNDIKDKLTTTPAEYYYTITATAEDGDGYTIIAIVKLNTQTEKIDLVFRRELNSKSDNTNEKEKND